MKPLDRVEAALERLVEGGAGRMFRARIQPAEIGRRLERAMAANTVVGIDGLLAPNRFRAALHPSDFAPFEAAAVALGAEFAAWLDGVAAERGWGLLGTAAVEIVADVDVPRRQIKVTVEMAGDPAGAGPDRRRAAAPVGGGPLRLLIASGGQRGQEVLARPPAATIGRDPACDVVLLDPSVSRRHARIEFGPAGPRVVDLGSSNGIWRNGARVADALLRPGDEVRFGAVAARVMPTVGRSSS
jgi:hypothetical protein